MVGIVGALASAVSVGLVLKSKSDEGRDAVEQIERHARNAMGDIRRGFRDLTDAFEDQRSLIARTVGDRNPEVYSHPTRAGCALLFTSDELVENVEQKGRIEKLIFDVQLKLNFLMQMAAKQNIKSPTSLIELIDDLTLSINAILSPESTFDSAFRDIDAALSRVNSALRKDGRN